MCTIGGGREARTKYTALVAALGLERKDAKQLKCVVLGMGAEHSTQISFKGVNAKGYYNIALKSLVDNEVPGMMALLLA